MKRNGRILFASLKGGVGKSTAALEVSAALASEGFRVLLVDLDFRSRSLDLMLGASDRVDFTIADCAAGRCGADGVNIRAADDGKGGELILCPACSEEDFESGSSYECLPGVLMRLEEETEPDYVVCDTGADSRVPRIIADGYAELAIVVSEQSRTSLRASEVTAARFETGKTVKEVRLLINKFDVEAARRGGRVSIIEMIDECSVKCIGVIPADRGVAARQDKGIVQSKGELATLAALNVARRIRGIQTPLFTGMKKIRKKVTL
ncbi:MAG: P-loop NTPase [Clostridia bacterium]|nr:P-loop NTPase [Clostridia bacterium]